MTYECATPSCAGREIYQYRNRWVHRDNGFALCNPINDPTVKAAPKPRKYTESPEAHGPAGPR